MPSDFTFRPRPDAPRARQNLPGVAVVVHVVGARLEDRVHQRLFGGLALLDDDEALLVEHAGDGVRLAQLPPHFVKVWRISPTVRFLLSVSASMSTATPPGRNPIHHLVVGDALFFARAAADRPLDVVGRHVDLLGVRDDGPQPRIRVRVAAAVSWPRRSIP
jgi:hypothetical protein